MRIRHVTLVLLGLGACSEQPSSTPGIPTDLRAVIFLQRAVRNDGMGNVFDYTSYTPGGRIVKLEPPSADGTLTVLTADPMFEGADFMSWDLSFDARTMVFSGRLATDAHYQIFTMNVDGTNVRQLTEGPYDYVYPIFLPGQKVMFTTSKNVEPDSPQFRDEYERAVTAQVGIVNLDGGGEVLGPRNVSHRVAPALLPDGRVLYTEWRHLGDVNDGHLRIMNADMTRMQEAFGGEGQGVTNSYLKARHVETRVGADGKESYRVVTIGTSRDRTLQAGKLLLVDLNGSEAASRVQDLTPLVPGGRSPSQLGVGRYYDAEVVGRPSDLQFLVSWADGPVESELLEQARSYADFGIYLLDGKTGRRFPIHNDRQYWDVLARPLRPRAEPTVTESPVSGSTFTLGAFNVYDSSLFKLAPGSAAKVRLLEGFSAEEGFPDMFGLTEFDGQSRYGEVPVHADGSFAATVPANVPLHMQVVGKFAMAVADEPIWISGRAGEQRFCGGCHEDRSKTPALTPGTTEAVQRGPVNLDAPRAARLSYDYSYEKIRGVPWDKVLQPIFDAKCVSCHDGDPGKPGNRSYTIVDRTAGTQQTFVFDLRAQKLSITVGEKMTGDFPASYVSLVGVGMELGENIVEIIGDMPSYVTAGSAATSELLKRLNPPQRFPVVDTAVRAFPSRKVHPADVGGKELTPDEYYQVILNIDMGAQFYFRENKGSSTGGYRP